MNFRIFRYFKGIGLTGTIFKVPFALIAILMFMLSILGILGFMALVYSLL